MQGETSVHFLINLAEKQAIIKKDVYEELRK